MSDPPAGPDRLPRVRVFESYGRGDASELAKRLRRDLEARHFDVWQDIERVDVGARFDEKIREAITNSEVVVALLSPHSTRSAKDGPDGLDSVCLDEIQFARSSRRQIVPVMALECNPPLVIFRLDCVDMQDWQASEEHYQAGFEKLIASIESALAGQPAMRAFVELLNPDQTLAENLDTTSLLEERRQNFTGREWLFAEIEGWRATTGERALLLVGDLGTGKSALAAELVHRNPGGQVVAYHCCIAGSLDTLSAGKFVPNIAGMLASQIPAYAEAISRGAVPARLRDAERDPMGAFQFGVLAPLAGLPPPDGPPRYILIDGLDEALSGEAGNAAVTIPDLLGTRLGTFPSWLRLLATSRPNQAVLGKLGGVRQLVLKRDDERNVADLRAYLDARLREPALAELVAGSELTHAGVLDRLSGLADGMFVYARQAVDALTHGNLTLGALERQPPGLANLYETSFKRTFPTPESFANCAELLAVLLAARRSLGRDQLQEILKVSAVELERRMAPLEPFLARADDALALTHKSLADWLRRPALGTTSFHVDPVAGEAALLAWCRRWPELDDDYPLRYLPAHLADAGLADELAGLLADQEFGRRRRAAHVSRLLEIEDSAALTSLLLRAGRIDGLVGLALTGSPYRRDGIALALSGAGESLDQGARAVVERLLSVGAGRGGGKLSAEQLSARVIGIDTAAHRGYADALTQAADDESAAVRAILVPYLYAYWRDHGEAGWALLDSLAGQLIGRFGLPRQSRVEVSGGLSLAILTRDFDDAPTVARLGEFWRVIVRRLLSSKLARTAGRGLTLKAVIAALTVVMRDQPDYQPLNLPELRRTFSCPGEHPSALGALRALEQPELGVEVVVAALVPGPGEFDVFLMAVAERALVVQGARDPGETIDAIERIYHDGCPWFHQSCLYSAFHTLNIAHSPQAAWLDRYARLTDEFVARDHAGLVTAAGRYTFPPHVPADSPLEATLVGALANIRLYEDATVDRFLRGLGDPDLASRVRAATPSVRAEEFPTWLDSFVNHQLVTSDAFRLELCGAFHRAAEVSNVRELLHDNVVWVLNLLAGEELVKRRD